MTNRISILQQFLSEDPNDVFSKYALALEFIKSGEIQKALALMKNLLESHPEYLPVYYQLGKLFELLQRKGEALEIYQKGIVLAKEKGNLHTANELQGAIVALDDEDSQ
jgi:tetratricopeptide (TPR) repeat protein